MTVGRKILSTLILASGAVGLLLSTSRASAADDAIATAVRQLADEKPAVRRQAIQTIAHSKDGRMVDFMKAYLAGNIYLWKDGGNRLVRCDETTKDSKGESQAPLADPLTDQPLIAKGKQIIVPKDDLDDQTPIGPDRRLVNDAITTLQLWAPDADERLAAVQKVGNSGDSQVIPALEEVAADQDASEKTRRTARESIAVIRIQSADTKTDDRLAAAHELGQLRSARGSDMLKTQLDRMDQDAAEIIRRVAKAADKAGEFTETDPAKVAQSKPDMIEVRLPTASPETVQKVEAALSSLDLSDLFATLKNPKSHLDRQQTVLEYELARSGTGKVDSDTRQAYETSLAQIDRYQRLVRGLGYVRDGISQGSILILMALGLAITFGVMGVINMAHGELMMIGAFATFVMQKVFVGYLPESMFNWYFVAALPVAFLTAAIAGYLIELLVVRFLYGRPLDTLLATWGVSIVLIQGVRAIFGNNIGVNAPTWFRGGFEVMQDLVLPYNRCFIVVLCALCVALIYGLLNYTKLGLRIRATVQNREMAAALGVSTRRIDGYTFALGAGIAGIAGYALTLIGGVTPDMGQNYIVESFLVVVTGGVGELAGTIYAGLGLGGLDKLLEPFTGAVWGQVLVLVAVILFIQRRPSGLFPPKGRLADV